MLDQTQDNTSAIARCIVSKIIFDERSVALSGSGWVAHKSSVYTNSDLEDYEYVVGAVPVRVRNITRHLALVAPKKWKRPRSGRRVWIPRQHLFEPGQADLAMSYEEDKSELVSHLTAILESHRGMERRKETALVHKRVPATTFIAHQISTNTLDDSTRERVLRLALVLGNEPYKHLQEVGCEPASRLDIARIGASLTSSLLTEASTKKIRGLSYHLKEAAEDLREV